jgi:hypothetical protein
VAAEELRRLTRRCRQVLFGCAGFLNSVGPFPNCRFQGTADHNLESLALDSVMMGQPTSTSTTSQQQTQDMETPTPEPRSTTPIPPALPPRSDKRALLLVYIHGFKGDETSFKDFPTVLYVRTRLIIASSRNS